VEGVLEQQAPAATRQARIAGLCYLLVIAGGLFAEGYVRETLVEPGDAAATARAIAADEALWRWGLAVHLVYLVPGLVVNVLVSGLFRAAAPTLARLALVLGVASVTVEASSLLQLSVPLAMLEEGGALAALGAEQRQALSYLAIRLFDTGFGFALLFFAGFCVLVGVLILRSRLVPRLIGLLMILAGACYAVNTLALVLSPALSDRLVPAILLPSFVGELSLALWLLVKGVRPTVAGARLPRPAGSQTP
jgi:Domain of unknown function (DUF4386)